MHTIGKILFLVLLTYVRFTSASIGRFLPFSGFYPIPAKTPEPIDINTRLTYPFFSIKPLTFTGNNGQEMAILQNNGRGATVKLMENYTTSAVTGGVLGANVYAYIQTIFRWTNTTNGVASTTIDGKYGSPLEVLVIFYNQKYDSFPEALKYRDGVTKILFRIKIVGSKPNLAFEPFAAAMKKIQKPGESVPIKLFYVYNWYSGLPPSSKYFTYPGSVSLEVNGKHYYCTTTIVPFLGTASPFISEKQFENTFLKLRDSHGNPLISVEPQHPQGLRPVARTNGILLIPYTNKRYPSIPGSL